MNVLESSFDTAEDSEARLWETRTTGAREALFDRYRDFARSRAKRHFRSRGFADVEFDDLCQFAYAGLLEAIDRFDLVRGVPFQAFAGRRISGSILDGIAHASEVREQVRFRARLRQERLASLTSEAIAEGALPQALDALTEIAVGLALGFMLDDTGLIMAGGGKAVAGAGYQNAAWQQSLGRLSVELGRLPKRDQTILRYHYFDDMDFVTVARALNLSKARVSQLHRAALALLARRLHGIEISREGS